MESCRVHAVFTLCLRCVYAVFTLCSHCARAVFTLCSHCVHAVFTLCSRCVHTVLTLCSRCVYAVFTLCSRCAHTVRMCGQESERGSWSFCDLCLQLLPLLHQLLQFLFHFSSVGIWWFLRYGDTLTAFIVHLNSSKVVSGNNIRAVANRESE